MEFKMHRVVNALMDTLPLLYMLFVYGLKIISHSKLLISNLDVYCTVILYNAKTQAKDKQNYANLLVLMLLHC